MEERSWKRTERRRRAVAVRSGSSSWSLLFYPSSGWDGGAGDMVTPEWADRSSPAGGEEGDGPVAGRPRPEAALADSAGAVAVLAAVDRAAAGNFSMRTHRFV